MNASCPACGARLETPLACATCGVLASSVAAHTPYEIFGLDQRYAVDRADLQRRLLRFARLLHPDYFATAAPEVRSRSERNSAELNAAFELLADDAARADWLVERLGGPSELELRDMPREFLMEVLEWNETLDAARSAAPGSAARAALAELERALAAQRRELLNALAARLDPLPQRGSPALADARRELNALRYVDRALREIERLRLEQAAVPH